MLKTITQVVLPVGAIFGVVFILTYIGNYTDPLVRTVTPENKDTSTAQISASALPLTFVRRIAEEDQTDRELKNWQSSYELGTEGFFDFWFRNPNPAEVFLTPRGKSCTCTSVDMGVISEENLTLYLQQRFLSGILGFPLDSLQAYAATQLYSQIKWERLVTDGGGDGTFPIPAAKQESQPILGMIRATFKAKAPIEPKRLSIALTSNFKEQPLAGTQLEVRIKVVSPLQIFIPGNRDGRVDLGELSSNSVSEKEVIFYSVTRPEMDVVLNPPKDKIPAGLLEIGKPIPLTADEIATLTKSIQANMEKPTPINIRSAARVKITLKERIAGVQLDLGPLDQMIDLEIRGAGEGVISKLPIRAVVRGDFRLIGTDKDQDRIDFGSFDARQRKIRQVEVIAEQAGIELDLKPLQVSPDFLDVKIEPIEDSRSGKKQWSLRVEIPAGKLLGKLPPDSFMILQSKDGKRRIRIPLVGTTTDFGASPF